MHFLWILFVIGFTLLNFASLFDSIKKRERTWLKVANIIGAACGVLILIGELLIN